MHVSACNTSKAANSLFKPNEFEKKCNNEWEIVGSEEGNCVNAQTGEVGNIKTES